MGTLSNFWLFGAATIKDGSCITDSDATSYLKHFLIILASLSGAAVTTAKLFWVVSFVGGGGTARAAAVGATSFLRGYFKFQTERSYCLGRLMIKKVWRKRQSSF